MKKFIAPVLASALTMTAVADLSKDFTVSAEGQINANYLDYDSNAKSSVENLADSHVTLSVAWKEDVKAVVRAKLQSALENGEFELKDETEFEDFIEEAYIEVRNLGGRPVALVVGKHPIAFGQNVEAMPIYTESLTRNINEIREVNGITVALEGLDFVDSVEVSAFEGEVAQDLKVSDVNGASIRLKKNLTEAVQMTLSHAKMGDEKRTSLGFIVTPTNKDNMVAWVEGTIISDNPVYKYTEYAITAGVKKSVTELIDVIAEYNYVDEVLEEFAIGAKLKLTKNLTAGAEIRHRKDLLTDEDDVIYGLTAQYVFGNPEKENSEYFFGDK